MLSWSLAEHVESSTGCQETPVSVSGSGIIDYRNRKQNTDQETNKEQASGSVGERQHSNSKTRPPEEIVSMGSLGEG